MNKKSFEKGIAVGIITTSSVVIIDNLMRDNITKPSRRRVRILYFVSLVSSIAGSMLADSYME